MIVKNKCRFCGKHIEAKLYRSWQCKECLAIYMKQYREQNKERIKSLNNLGKQRLLAKKPEYHKVYDKEYKRVKYATDEAYREQMKERSKRGRQKYRSTIEKNRKQLKLDAINAYGGKCACCGINHYEFMAIDHIYGNGNKHRKENKTGSGQQFYRWLKKENYPEGFRVLCHNCNMSYGLYGYCPHQKVKNKYGNNCYKD